MTELEQLRSRYHQLLHAMQSGVAVAMQYERSQTDPKHLRVGINSAMVEHAALVRLLLERGVISELDYYRALTTALEEEVQRYTELLTEWLGTTVRLS